MDRDCQQDILEQVQHAVASNQALNIIGGNSKSFYGRLAEGHTLSVAEHSGVVNYEPSELVITARAGTPINEVQTLLAANNQMLGFEPPFCNTASTLGGVIAAGLSGPRRPYSGAVRDYILGIKMINGKAEVLNFGGQVMKNVAGFDHSRLLTGSLGTLGVLLELSLRVMPVPELEKTRSIEHDDSNKAIEFFNQLAAKPYPVTATAWYQGRCYVRLSGTENGVQAAVKKIGADVDTEISQFWPDLKDQRLDEFKSAQVVHRISAPAATRINEFVKDQIIEWNGAQRWLFNRNREELGQLIDNTPAHITQFRGGDRNAEVFAQLDPASMRLHQNIKKAFDPQRIFNVGRMYKDL